MLDFLCPRCSCSSVASVITRDLVVCPFAAGSSAMATWGWGQHTRALLRLSMLFLTNLYQKWFQCRLHFATKAESKFVATSLICNSYNKNVPLFRFFSSKKEVPLLQCRSKMGMDPLQRMKVTCFSLKRWCGRPAWIKWHHNPKLKHMQKLILIELISVVMLKSSVVTFCFILKGFTVQRDQRALAHVRQPQHIEGGGCRWRYLTTPS